MPKTEFIGRILDRRDKVDKELVEEYLLELAQERDFLKAIFDSISDGVLNILADGRTIFANSAAQRFLGFYLPDVIGQNVLKWLQQSELLSVFQNVIEKGAPVNDLEVLISEPTMRLLNVTIKLVSYSSGDLQCILILMEDISEKHARVQERRRMDRLLSIGHMAAGMAHEIRNPLNSLSLRIQLLKRTLDDAKVVPNASMPESIEEDFQIIESEVERLNQVVERVLAASVSMPKKLEPLEPQSIIEHLRNLVRRECEQAGIRLKYNIKKGQDVKILADDNSLRQAFLNIVNNAVQAMPNGGELEIRLETDSDWVCFSFKDTGPGMIEEERERIFEPYYTSRAKGTGLGLMIVERVVQNHSGKIEVMSSPGKGSEFQIFLPAYYGKPRMLKMENQPDKS